MSLELNIRCTGCRKQLAEGDEIFCERCNEDQEKQIKELTQELHKAICEIVDLKNEISRWEKGDKDVK
jgi:phage FluMu protein Com